MKAKEAVRGRKPKSEGAPPAAKQKETPHSGHACRFSIPVAIVILLCITFAVQIGAFQQEILFQKAPMSIDGSAGNRSAYASGNRLLFYLEHRNASFSAEFEGSGAADSIAYGIEGSGVGIERMEVGGNTACSPCTPGKKYPIRASGRIAVAISAREKAVGPPEESAGSGRPFFEKNTLTFIEAPLSIELGGNWAAKHSSSVPSSFYGVDAPFHIHRVPVGASHALRLQWPWAEYTFISAMPASAIYLALGVGHEYAYKLWEIALFFMPVALFYAFSRKLSTGKDAAFLFASLLYVFVPTQGMLTGGGADLFMYGMTAHTLATCLSLFALMFSYEFVMEKKSGSFWPAAILFALAAASNQRILLSLAIGFGALFAFSLALSNPRRAVVLGAACAALGAIFAAPLVFSMAGGGFGSYPVLEGASTEDIVRSVAGFFQLGYFVLPLFFAAGVAASFLRKEAFPLFLSAVCALVFIIATSPELNRMAPFMDGIRFMPSFFLPVFFLAGFGLFACYGWLVAWWGRHIAGRLGLDRLDATASIVLAVILPLSALFTILAISSADQYRLESDSLPMAAEYSELEAAYGLAGSGCVVYDGRSQISHYPIYGAAFARTQRNFAKSYGGLADHLRSVRCRHVLLGNMKISADANGTARWEEYGEISRDSRLVEIRYGGSSRMFALREDNSAAKVESSGARIDSYSFDYDRGSVQGECMGRNCSLRIRNDDLPASVQCSGIPGCAVRRGEPNAIWIDGVPQGEFEISLEPKIADWFYPMAAACIAIALACGYLAGRMGD